MARLAGLWASLAVGVELGKTRQDSLGTWTAATCEAAEKRTNEEERLWNNGRFVDHAGRRCGRMMLASSEFWWLEEKRPTLVESRRVAEDGAGKQLAWTRGGAASLTSVFVGFNSVEAVDRRWAARGRVAKQKGETMGREARWVAVASVDGDAASLGFRWCAAGFGRVEIAVKYGGEFHRFVDRTWQ